MGAKGGSVTVGYRYFMSLHMGVCRGPIDELVQINVGDVRAWPLPDGDTEEESGLALIAQGPGNTGVALYENGTSATVLASKINTKSGPTNKTIDMKAGELFGGDKKEGGVEGKLQLLFGGAAQVVPAYIKTILGGRVPEFRGAFTMFYDGLLCSLNPYPKPWKVRVRRTVNGWDGAVWQPDLATIWLANGTIKAMNPAHIIYESLTNRDWARGFPRAFLNDAAFVAFAQKLYDEKFGLCLKWNRQAELSDFIKDVIDHVGGYLYLDRLTGLLTPALMRNDYEIDEVPIFDYDTGLLSVEEDETLTRDELVNEIVVDWHDPIKNEDRQSRIHNLASLQSLKAFKSTTASYDGLPVDDLALRVAQRDLAATSTALKRYKIKVDRRGWRIIPGSVFGIRAPELGIDLVILRAGNVKEQASDTGNGEISVEAVLDVFGLPAASFISTQPTEWMPPDRSALIVSRRITREATYADVVRNLPPAEVSGLDPTSGFIATVAGKPSSLSQGYGIASRVGSSAFVERRGASFCPTAKLNGAIGMYATSVPFNNGMDMGLIVIGTAVQIGDEICRLDDIVSADGVSGTMTIARGCTDTLPAIHASGADIFFIDDDAGTDGVEYSSGETVDVKLLSTTSTQKLSMTAAPTDALPIVGRQGRPWPPANLRINTTPYGNVSSVAGDIALTWTHRDRLLTQDMLVEHGAASMGPEDGVSYTLRFYSSLGAPTPVRDATGITGTAFTYTTAMKLADGLTTTVVIELEAIRDGLTSTFKYRFSLAL